MCILIIIFYSTILLKDAFVYNFSARRVKHLQFTKDVNFPREWLFKFDSGVLLLRAKHRRWHGRAFERVRRDEG